MALRFLPALAGAAIVFLTGIIARELGGDRFAQILAALGVLAIPVFFGTQFIYSMNSFDQLFWTLGAFILVKLIKTEEPIWWLLLGLLIGLGMQNKLSMLWLGIGIAVGILLTPLRKSLLTKWPWIAAGISLVIFLPHLLWQMAHDWPTLEFMRNATSMKMVLKSPLDFLGGQMFMLNPALLPFWLIGLLSCLFWKNLRPFRILAWIYLAVFTLLMFNQASRDYYLAPAYPMLFAAGGVAIAHFIRQRSWGWLKAVLLIYIILSGALSAPFALPLLPVETFISYAEKSGLMPAPEERHEMGALPQHYADMFGWENMVKTVAEVYHDFSLEEQAKCGIFASNYGEAGAIDFFGPHYGLPKAISGHNNYWLWGAGETSREQMIVLGTVASKAELEQFFFEVEYAARFTCEYCMPYENNMPIYVVRGLKIPLEKLWSSLKHYS